MDLKNGNSVSGFTRRQIRDVPGQNATLIEMVCAEELQKSSMNTFLSAITFRDNM